MAYKYLIPAYGLSAEDEAFLQSHINNRSNSLRNVKRESENGVFSNQTSMDLEELENLAVSFINQRVLPESNVQVKDYTFYDILVLDRYGLKKQIISPSCFQPSIISMYYNLTLVLKLLLTIDICIANKHEIKAFDEFLTKKLRPLLSKDTMKMGTGISSAVVTDYNTTDYESVGRRS